MKKILAIMMALLMLLSFAACGGNGEEETTTEPEITTTAPAEIEEETTEAEKTTEPEETTTEAEATEKATEAKTEKATKAPVKKPAKASPVEILKKVWASYADEEKFPAAGGDMTEANMNMEGPGVYGLEDAEGFTATTHFPADAMSKIDSAATLMHMMNANTFTCAAYRLVNSADAKALAGEVKDSIMSTQWMCGFPEKLVIAVVDGCVISCFGNGEIVDNFTAKLQAAYSSAEVVVNEAIVA